MIPKFSEYFSPFINAIKDGNIYTVKEIRDRIAMDLNLTKEDLNEQTKGGRNKHEDRVKWVVTYLKKLDLIQSSKKGLWKISPKGEMCLEECKGDFCLNTLRDMQGYQDFIKDKSKSHWVEGHYRDNGTYVAGYASFFFSKGIRKIKQSKTNQL